eukprot:gene5728-25026_t
MAEFFRRHAAGGNRAVRPASLTNPPPAPGDGPAGAVGWWQTYLSEPGNFEHERRALPRNAQGLPLFRRHRVEPRRAAPRSTGPRATGARGAALSAGAPASLAGCAERMGPDLAAVRASQNRLVPSNAKKTQLCRYFEAGDCWRGEKCLFKHSAGDRPKEWL